jgi:glucose-6-phosphate isomerase
MTLYRQSIPGSAHLTGYMAGLERAEAALAEIMAEAAGGEMHPLTIAEESADLAPAKALAERIRQEAEHVVVIGIGGSGLGAQAIAQLRGYYTPLTPFADSGPHMHFLDNPDGPVMSAFLDALPLEKTRFIVVSKSGSTAEPMMQALAVISHLDRQGLKGKTGQLMAAITEPKDNALTRLAERHSMPRLAHPTDIGGRYSVLSVVGLLPALVMGLDAAAIRAGAAEVWKAAQGGGRDVVEGAAFAVAGAEAGKPISVLMPYTDRLERFALWYRQLWAESLGKGGKGTLPVRALGPVDQHSQLQLYLDGPANALFTLMTVSQEGTGPEVPKGSAGDPALSYLEGRYIGDLVTAEARATFETLEAHQRPARMMAVLGLDEQSLGALFMHFMLETILTARMIGVNAFDQPAVEEGKVLARKYLQEAGKK